MIVRRDLIDLSEMSDAGRRLPPICGCKLLELTYLRREVRPRETAPDNVVTDPAEEGLGRGERS